VFAGDHLAAAEQFFPNFLQRHGGSLTGYARPIYEAGQRVRAWEYRAALDAFERYRDSVQECLEETDVLVTSATETPPAVADEADPGDLGARYDLLSMWNFTGNPALVVPLAPGADGLPRAVQLVGRRGEDRLLLRLALALARVSSASHALPVAAGVD
jgi:amidase